MNAVRQTMAAVGIALAAAIAAASPARAQSAVGFAPTIGTIPDGVILNATPAVSADRRYVRLSAGPTFVAFDRFDTFTVPAAVGGGGGGFPGGGFPGGFPSVGLGGGGALSGFADPNPPSAFAVLANQPPPPRPKASKGRSRTRQAPRHQSR